MKPVKQNWMNELNKVHKFNVEELQVMKEAYAVKQDPRFTGKWDDALSIAFDLYFGRIEVDPDAMRISL